MVTATSVSARRCCDSARRRLSALAAQVQRVDPPRQSRQHLSAVVAAAAATPPPFEVRGAGSDSPFSAVEYRERGFTGPVTLFAPVQAERVRAAFDAATQQLISDVAGGGQETVTKNGTRINSGKDLPPSTHPATWGDTLPFAQDEALLDLCSEILGPDLVLWATVFWAKPPHTTKYIPWHQDAVYWPLEPRINITVWIALTPIHEPQGRLSIIPGSQGWLDDEYQTLERDAAFGRGLTPEQVDEPARVEFDLAPGQAIFFSEGALHSSGPNCSDQPRLALALRITTPEVNSRPQSFEPPWKYYLYLASGVRMLPLEPLHYDRNF